MRKRRARGTKSKTPASGAPGATDRGYNLCHRRSRLPTQARRRDFPAIRPPGIASRRVTALLRGGASLAVPAACGTGTLVIWAWDAAAADAAECRHALA